MRRIWTAGLIAVVVASGCSRRQPPEVAQPPQPVPQAQQPTPQPQPQQPTGNAEAEREAERRRLTSILEQVVHFDYDESTIRADAQERLAAKVPVLRANPNIRMRIDGHADERGSVEYNLALGMRRANAVRQYLADFGIDVNRFEIFSYGEDRPLVQGSGESAWSQNRRAEFRVTSGLD